jgi:hypothetical protein
VNGEWAEIRDQKAESGKRIRIENFNRRENRDRRVEMTENMTADDSDFTDGWLNFFTKVNEGNKGELKDGSEILNRRGHRDRRVEMTEDMTTDDSDFADERQEFFHKR